MSDTVHYLINLSCGGVGAIAGWLCNKWISDSRDKRNRRHELVKFLCEWRSKIGRQGDISHYRDIYAIYISAIHQFNGLLHVVKMDRKNDRIFEQLSSRIIKLKKDDFSYYRKAIDYRKMICNNIDDLVAHLEKIND